MRGRSEDSGFGLGDGIRKKGLCVESWTWWICYSWVLCVRISVGCEVVAGDR